MPRCSTCHRRLALGATCPDDGGAAPGPEPVQNPGAQPEIEGYRLGQRLGSGGFAAVWAAERESDGMPVAIKLAHHVDERGDRRLEREAEALQRVGPPHVPRYHGSGRLADGRLFLIMERLSGRTLAAALESMPGPPDTPWIRAVSKGLLAALEAVHAHGIVHRDLKPENVFLPESVTERVTERVAESATERAPESVTEDDAAEIRLIDFGLVDARLVDLGSMGARQSTGGGDVTRPGEILGTAEYMAPEQVRGGDAGVHSDIYALGVLFYELFTLRPPFVGDRTSIEHGHVALRPPRPRQFAPVPEAVELVILSCLAKNPARRPADVGSLRRALGSAWSHAGADPGAAPSEGKVSLLVEKQQPVVVAAVDADVEPREVDATVKRHGGFVARQRGRRYVCAFSGLMVDDPVEAALASAHELCERFDARAALHLTRLAIRSRRRGPPAVLGRAVDEPETWLPRDAWQGVLLTAALVQTRPEGTTRPARAHPGFAELVVQAGPLRAHTTLVGREHVMERAGASLRACLDTSSPGLFTIVGEEGLGKTRLGHELAGMARTICPDATIIAARAAKIDTRAFARATRRSLAALRARGLALGERHPPARESGPLVLIVDDAHWADHDLLDQIEYATLDHHGVPLWVVVTAHPHLETARAQWGSRAHRHDRHVLAPLATEAAMALAAELLLPAEYPPAAFLQRLTQWAHGNPQLLTGLVAELKRRGVVHKREQGQGWDVRTAELERLPAAPAGQWLAARVLAEMPPELAACVRVCAVLGPSFAGDELAWVQDAMERYGGAGTPMDTEVGIDELVAQSVFERSGSGELAFCNAAFQDAVYKLLAADDREQIHRHATRYWESQLGPRAAGEALRGPGTTDPELIDWSMLEHFARHAGACGRAEEAASAWLRLGDAARKAHRYVEADSYYTNALRLSAQAPRAHARALGSRGEVRYHMYRTQEAFADLRRARELHEQLDDDAAVVELLLSEATVADAASDYETAAERARDADARLARVVDQTRRSVLETRCLMAMGRTHWRQGQNVEAIELLTRAAQRAGAGEDYETEVIAHLLLGVALVYKGRHQEAERIFDAALARCIAIRDRLHECAVYANRMYLWRKQPRRAIGDLRRAIQLAREIGNPEPERVATHNLAELLYWSGEADEALALVLRSRALQQRFWSQVPLDALLLARIRVGRDEFDAAREPVEWLARECNLPQDQSEPYVHLLYCMVTLVLEGRDAPERSLGTAWAKLVSRANAALPTEEYIEVCWWAARSAMTRGDREQARSMLQDASARLDDAPIWRQRIEALLRRLPE
jgi:eukaryotic-like serine/threonine-protein kinase